MLRFGVLIILLSTFFVSAVEAAESDGQEGISRSQILREHHHLMSEMLMVMKDNVDITKKLLDGRISPSDRKAMKKKMADMAGEVNEMIQKHDRLMKMFDEMTQKKEVKPDKGPEAAPSP